MEHQLQVHGSHSHSHLIYALCRNYALWGTLFAKIWWEGAQKHFMGSGSFPKKFILLIFLYIEDIFDSKLVTKRAKVNMLTKNLRFFCFSKDQRSFGKFIRFGRRWLL